MVSEAIDRDITSGDRAHILAGAQSETQVPRMLKTNRKRRRVDEDFKAAMVECPTNTLKAKNARSMISATTELSPNVANTWEENTMKAIMQGIRTQMTCAGVVFHSSDASRHGRPAENTQLTAIWDAQTDLSCVAKPIATLLVEPMVYMVFVLATRILNQ